MDPAYTRHIQFGLTFHSAEKAFARLSVDIGPPDRDVVIPIWSYGNPLSSETPSKKKVAVPRLQTYTPNIKILLASAGKETPG